MSENGVYRYTPNYSHLVGIMISKTIGCRGTLFSDKPIWFYRRSTWDRSSTVEPIPCRWMSGKKVGGWLPFKARRSIFRWKNTMEVEETLVVYGWFIIWMGTQGRLFSELAVYQTVRILGTLLSSDLPPQATNGWPITGPAIFSARYAGMIQDDPSMKKETPRSKYASDSVVNSSGWSRSAATVWLWLWRHNNRHEMCEERLPRRSTFRLPHHSWTQPCQLDQLDQLATGHPREGVFESNASAQRYPLVI